MRNKRTKSGKCLCLVLALALTCVSNVEAKNDSGMRNKYVESHHQISMEGIELSYDKGRKEIDVNISDDVKWYKKNKVKQAKEKINFLLNRYDEGLDELLIETMEVSDGELIGLAYTECPLEMNSEGQLVRIEDTGEYENNNSLLVENAGAVTGSTSKKYYFSLVTSVIRSNSKDANGRYLYTCRTNGSWSANSIVSGSKYPASGNDYILQSVPNSFTRTCDYLTIAYDTMLPAHNGTHYSRENGASNYVKYSVVDDPLGIAQIRYSNLTTCYRAKPGTGRIINSYYVHTWKSMSLSVSVSASSDKAVSLSLTPSVSDKSWQVYSYVTFDF